MIEDDINFSKYLGKYLNEYHMFITNYEDPYLALSCGIHKFDIIILDLTLPGLDGLEVCKKIKQDFHIPIIISSARGDIDDKIVGFENGADDYLAKPYDPKEMHLRIQKLLNIYQKIDIKNLSKKNSDFVLLENEILYKNKILNLTKGEFDVLSVLIKSFNHTISREQIVNSCDSLSDSYGKTLNTIVGRIRNKTSQEAIHTVRGIGYKLVD
jgi:two-component system OmpR family response regulator